MTPLTRLKIKHVAGGLLLVAAAILYLLTLDNGLRPDELVGGDLITHQYAQVEARPSNAPGYPLYTMGGWLWFRVGQGLLGWLLNPIQILSFYSTLWGLASLAILYLILLKIAGRQWPLALLLAAFYATTFFFWYYTVTTEQYTSALFQTLLLIWLAFRWEELPKDSTLLGMAFISGTMLANMVTTLFILPPLLWFIFSKKTDNGYALFDYLKRPKLILQAAGVTLLPLASYAYIYIRGAQHPEWRGAGQWNSTWEWFIQFLTIQQGRDELAPGLSLQTIFTGEFPALMGQELTWPIFLGGLLGLAGLGHRRAIFLYGTLVIYFIFSWGYRFGNWFQVIIPAYPIFIIGAAAGLRQVSEWANRRIGERPRSATKDREAQRTSKLKTQNSKLKTQNSPHFSLFTPHFSLITLLLTALLIYRFTTNLPRANQQNLPADTGLNPGWAIVADGPAVPSTVAGTFEERVALQYLTTVWGLLPGLTPTDALTLTQLQKATASQSTLYVSRQAAAAAPEIIQGGRVFPQAAGEQLILLRPTPLQTLPPEATPLELDFGNNLQLVGREQLQPDRHLPPNIARQLERANWQIGLYWRASAKIDDDYTMSVRPLVGGQPVMHGDEPIIQDHQPVWGVYPTGRWTPNIVVRDVYALSLPHGITPDAVQIVVYKTTDSGFENLGEHTIPLGQDRR